MLKPCCRNLFKIADLLLPSGFIFQQSAHTEIKLAQDWIATNCSELIGKGLRTRLTLTLWTIMSGELCLNATSHFNHRRRLFKMTAGARFQSPSEWRWGSVWGGGVPHWGWGLGKDCAPSPEKKMKFLAEINAFWWDFDAVLIPLEMHNYRPTSTYILLGGSGFQSNLVLVHWLTQSEPYDYENESTTII